MFKRDRLSTLVLGLAILAAFVFAPAPPVTAQPSNAQEQQQASGEEQASGSENFRNRGISRFVTTQDTLAQWLMAVLALAATIISIWAVILLRLTLRATQKGADFARETVAVTREIGEAQTRAYLFVEKATYKVTKDLFQFDVHLVNAGQSPASQLSISADLTLQAVTGSPGHFRVSGWANSSAKDDYLQPINVGGSTIETLMFGKEMDFEFPHDYGIASLYERFEIFNEMYLELDVSWIDVFEKRHSIKANMSAVFAPSPSSPRKKRARSGVMQLRSEEPSAFGNDADD